MINFIKQFGACFALLCFLVSCADDNHQQGFEMENDTFGMANNEGEALSADLSAEAGDRVFFDFDVAELNSNAVYTLNRQISWVRAHNIKSITIEGHCDERGTREYNLGLGQKRANAVKEYLQSALPDVQLNVISYGKDKPIKVDDNASDSERYKQNRVAVTIIG